MKHLILLVIGAGVCGGCGQGGADTEVVEAESAVASTIRLTPDQEVGRLVYETLCWSCHGPAGRGDGPAVQAGGSRPPTFHTLDFARADVERVEQWFRGELVEAEETHPHVQYVTSVLKAECLHETLAFVPLLAYPPELPGSALAGEGIYAYRCAGCQGETGAGDGPAVEHFTLLVPTDLRSDTLIAAGNFNAVFHRILGDDLGSHSTYMPPWGNVLSEGEIWDVVAYLATLQPGVLSPFPEYQPH
jgi:mono/diheme cytochrome c family protein